MGDTFKACQSVTRTIDFVFHGRSADQEDFSHKMRIHTPNVCAVGDSEAEAEARLRSELKVFCRDLTPDTYFRLDHFGYDIGVQNCSTEPWGPITVKEFISLWSKFTDLATKIFNDIRYTD